MFVNGVEISMNCSVYTFRNCTWYYLSTTAAHCSLLFFVPRTCK